MRGLIGALIESGSPDTSGYRSDQLVIFLEYLKWYPVFHGPGSGFLDFGFNKGWQTVCHFNVSNVFICDVDTPGSWFFLVMKKHGTSTVHLQVKITIIRMVLLVGDLKSCSVLLLTCVS